MAHTIRDVMTHDPITMTADSPVTEAAMAMRESDIGDVIVLDQTDQVCGMVTDRDITIRVVAEGRDPSKTKLGEICSRDLAAVTPDDSVGDAVKLMSEKAIRRLPVIDGGRPIGIVSIGDLAVERDPDSALADISAAPPNR
jgi:CBS domain-containing protein